jgi:hypothetical protein
MSHSLPKLRVSLLVTIGAAALLAGCDTTNLSRTFGLTRDAPDEFSVSTRAPLSMPPNNALRAPRPGASRPQELSSRAAAEATLSPGAVLESSTNTSPGQLALVQASGRPIFAPRSIPTMPVSKPIAASPIACYSGNRARSDLGSRLIPPSKPSACAPMRRSGRIRLQARPRLFSRNARIGGIGCSKHRSRFAQLNLSAITSSYLNSLLPTRMIAGE